MITPKTKFVRFRRSTAYAWWAYPLWQHAAEHGCLFRLKRLPRRHAGCNHIAIPMCPCVVEQQRLEDKAGYVWNAACMLFNDPDMYGGIYLQDPHDLKGGMFEQVEVWHSPSTSRRKKSKKPKGKS